MVKRIKTLFYSHDAYDNSETISSLNHRPKKNSPFLQRITDRDETFILKDRTIADSYRLKLMPLLKSAIDLKAFMNTAININEIKTLILLLRFPLPSTLGDRKTMMQGSGVGGGHVRARRPTWRQGAWASLRP